ncbi:MAG: UDP-N-acetylglucosamine 2-epimerase, partial [Desulfobia sp.]
LPLFLWKDARLVLTDSGGLQEETTALGIPCLTLSENTERPVTIEMGTNRLVGSEAENIYRAYQEMLERFPSRDRGKPKQGNGRSLLSGTAGPRSGSGGFCRPTLI